MPETWRSRGQVVTMGTATCLGTVLPSTAMPVDVLMALNALCPELPKIH
ncbi:MAG: hypothetical protein HC918_04420 [Oscillatoriales cyanobacterium SM2_1_8]|nr:hypothetical protein [Oscillatoriales cyanobacterium SM2_1_8]